jgi:hypothetical protein
MVHGPNGRREEHVAGQYRGRDVNFSSMFPFEDAKKKVEQLGYDALPAGLFTD